MLKTYLKQIINTTLQGNTRKESYYGQLKEKMIKRGNNESNN